PDTDAEWEVHGPHGADFNYQVYIGPARARDGATTRAKSRRMTVVIYPRAVYEIEDGDESRWRAAGGTQALTTFGVSRAAERTNRSQHDGRPAPAHTHASSTLGVLPCATQFSPRRRRCASQNWHRKLSPCA